VAAERELGIDPFLEPEEAELFEPLHLEPRERLELEIGQRPPSPQPLGFAQERGGSAGIVLLERSSSLADERLERVQV
jgi:hypothetical protein